MIHKTFAIFLVMIGGFIVQASQSAVTIECYASANNAEDPILSLMFKNGFRLNLDSGYIESPTSDNIDMERDLDIVSYMELDSSYSNYSSRSRQEQLIDRRENPEQIEDVRIESSVFNSYDKGEGHDIFISTKSAQASLELFSSNINRYNESVRTEFELIINRFSYFSLFCNGYDLIGNNVF